MDNREQQILKTKIDMFNAGKKNQGGAAYNLMNSAYEQNQRGLQLQQQEYE